MAQEVKSQQNGEEHGENDCTDFVAYLDTFYADTALSFSW